ncbi:MAG TPA: hypothetical protein VFW60_08915 [Rhodanobacteraceae bacterium]|nr:hypothetical protein [Rhodanobacteraceae bacterium]
MKLPRTTALLLALIVPGIAPVVHAGANGIDNGPSAIALSYDGQHLALIASDHGNARLELASPSGLNLRVVDLPGGCAVRSIGWAPKRNLLAASTQCGGKSDPSGIRSAVWVLDPQAGKRPRKLADLKGTARDVQWIVDGNVGSWIAFLHASDGNGNAVVAKVPLAGGSVQAITPATLDVHEFRCSLYYWNNLMFTAVPVGVDNSAIVPELFVNNLADNAAPTLVFDPNTAKGALHGIYVTEPRGGESGLIFLGKTSRYSSSGNLYRVAVKAGATPVNATENLRVKVSWFELGYGGWLATQVTNGKTKVVKLSVYETWARRTAVLFTLPGTISDGRAPSSFSTTIKTFRNGNVPRIAFLQRASPRGPAVARVGRIGTQPPPRIELAKEAIAAR